MTTTLKFSDIKSKTSLKSQIIKGQVKVYECDTNHDLHYRLVENTNSILNLWAGFHLPKKYQAGENEAFAFLGNSYQYKFSN